MIIISLDEQGKFEEKSNEPTFIAGVIYESASKEDIDLERKRIQSYYRNVFNEVGNQTEFPRDLHVKNGANNNKKVSLIKEKVNKTLADYFQSGSYKGYGLNDEKGKPLKDSEGIYHIFVMLKSDAGKKDLLSKNTNKFAKDDYASNLYSHMAGGIVNRVIFHNPLLDNKKESVYVDIASRASADIERLGKEKSNEFLNLGIKATLGKINDFYVIADDKIYRTLIQKEMLDSKETNVNIEDIKVSSISYAKSAEDMEFLWLSDSLCSYLGRKLEKSGENADAWLNEIDKRVNTLNPFGDNLIFAYDEIDEKYSEAYSYYEKGDLFNCLSIIYDASRRNDAFSDYYNQKLFKDLENKVIDNVNVRTFSSCLDNLSRMLISNDLNQEKLVYLLEKFEIIKNKNIDKFYKAEDDKARAIFKLYDAAVAGYCHVGKTDMARNYYKKCLEYSKYVSISDILRIRNRYETCLCDNFEFKLANNEAKTSLEVTDKLNEIRKAYFNEKITGNFLDSAKAKSQLAQTYAFRHDSKAEEFFIDALSEIDNNSANYKITQSYLLHYYADTNAKKKFEIEASSYFDGRSSYDERYKYLMECAKNNNPVFNIKYMTYIFVRGLYTFGMGNLDYELLKKVTAIPDDFKAISPYIVNGHPWEIIYKYLALMCLDSKVDKMINKGLSSIVKVIISKKSPEKSAADFINLLTDQLNIKGKIIEAIERYQAVEIFNKVELLDKRNAAIKETVKYLKENFDIFNNKNFPEDYDECLEELNKYFRFMYR